MKESVLAKEEKMTVEALRQKPTGVLERRSLTINHDGKKYEEHYFLGKCENGMYFIGFSDDGNYCSNIVCEECMVKLINDKNHSDREAFDIYMISPQLSCWMTD